MKKLLVPLAAAVLLVLLLATPSGLAQSSPTPTPPSAPPILRGHNPPAIHAAIAALEEAKAEMQAASHDYGGHRADAVAACDVAISQLRLALEYANEAPALQTSH